MKEKQICPNIHKDIKKRQESARVAMKLFWNAMQEVSVVERAQCLKELESLQQIHNFDLSKWKSPRAISSAR